MAIGEEAEDNQAKASVSRNVCDGMLFKVAVLLNGRRCIALDRQWGVTIICEPRISNLGGVELRP